MAGLPELETTHPAAARAPGPELRATPHVDPSEEDPGAPGLAGAFGDDLEGLREGFDLDDGALDDEDGDDCMDDEAGGSGGDDDDDA